MNLAALLDGGVPFIIPPTMQLTSVKELMSAAQTQVMKAQYLWKFEKEAIVGEITKQCARYLNWKFDKEQGRFEVSLKQKAVTQRVNRMGRYILLYLVEMDWLTRLTLYRQ